MKTPFDFLGMTEASPMNRVPNALSNRYFPAPVASANWIWEALSRCAPDMNAVFAAAPDCGHCPVVYELLFGVRVVYVGSTGQLSARLEEHWQEGKNFTSYRVVSRHRNTREARQAEKIYLHIFRVFSDYYPKYNKTAHG